jgi:cell wall-associated NlpC family hydrolase
VSTHVLRSRAPIFGSVPADAAVEPDISLENRSKRQGPMARVLALLTIIAAIASLGACTANSTTNKGAQIVNLARTHIGARYVFGAAGPSTFDCSGLTQYVHRQAGIAIPRTTGSQLASARKIAKSAAQPGDLIFIGNYHVGIFVGGGQMIDAPKTGDVVRQRAIWTSGYTVGRFW